MQARRRMKTRTQQGFTLIEIAMVVLIIGLITSGLLLGMGGIIDSAKYKDDQQRLKDIKTALLSHVAQKGYLPCPDIDNDGVENRTGNSCESHRGFLPHIDLNTHAYNAYNARFYYQIDNTLTPPSTSSSVYFQRPGASKDDINKAESGRLSVCEKLSGTTCENYLAKNVPVIVASFGKNSVEAWGDYSNTTPPITPACPATLSDKEQLNCRSKDLTTTEPEYFYQAHDVDDTLIWLSSFDIKVEAGAIKLDEKKHPDFDTCHADCMSKGLTSEQCNFLCTALGHTSPPPGGGTGSDPSTRLDAGLFGNYDTTHAGDYNNNHSITTTNQDNRIRIEDDLNKDINLLNGTDVLSIGGNANASITAGNQDKVLLIEGDANGAGISFGNGNNRIEIRGALNTSIQLGNGDNWVRVEGAVNGSGIQLGNGENKVYIGGDIYQNIINGGHANSTLYLNKTPTEWSAVSWQHSRVSGFNQILCRQSSGSLDFVSCN